jgi:hypothetical protein
MQSSFPQILVAASYFTYPTIVRLKQADMLQCLQQFGYNETSSYEALPRMATSFLHDLLRGPVVVHPGSDALSPCRQSSSKYRETAGFADPSQFTFPGKNTPPFALAPQKN